MVKWITPSLAVCTADDLPDVLTAMEVGKAASWIKEGGNSYVDSDDTAADVLAELGLTDAEIEDRLRFANERVIL
jgi:hypothetical protein